MKPIRIHLVEADLELIKSHRMRHWESLPEPRELFLEMKVRSSRAFRIVIGTTHTGYACVTSDRELSEFWIDTVCLPRAELIFEQVIRKLEITAVWCHSFDRLTLSLCLDRGWKAERVGFLFRSKVSVKKITLPEGIEVRKGTPEDLDRILEKDDSYFESREEAEMVLSGERLFYFHRGDEFIACGTIMHNFQDSGVYDIGMLVSPDHRRKGIGTAIIQFLSDYCQQHGWQPICGCAADNIASRRTLEKAGFVTRDRMILFKAN